MARASDWGTRLGALTAQGPCSNRYRKLPMSTAKRKPGPLKSRFTL